MIGADILDKLKGIEIDGRDRATIKYALLYVAVAVAAGLGWAIYAGKAEVVSAIMTNAMWAGVALIFVLVAGQVVHKTRVLKTVAETPKGK